jgi:hypothetical protein
VGANVDTPMIWWHACSRLRGTNAAGQWPRSLNQVAYPRSLGQRLTQRLGDSNAGDQSQRVDCFHAWFWLMPLSIDLDGNARWICHSCGHTIMRPIPHCFHRS